MNLVKCMKLIIFYKNTNFKTDPRKERSKWNNFHRGNNNAPPQNKHNRQNSIRPQWFRR
jgi:hypothetical protein